jgi:sec-independent protein translocase protein TatC
MDKIRRVLKWLLLAPFRLVWWLISLPFRFLGWLFRPVAVNFKQGTIYHFLTDVPEDRPAFDAISDAFENPIELFEQLDAVRKHLTRALLVVVVAVGISFYFTQDLIAFLAVPIGGLKGMQAIEVTESVGVFMKVALISGSAFASPYVAFEIWLFIAPGLMPRSRQIGLTTLPLAFVFFLCGMAFTYYVLLPNAMPILLHFLNVDVKLRPASYFEFVTGLLFWIGLAFEFPLVIYALTAMGLVQPGFLLKQWRIAIVIISVIAAVITPTVDPVNMSLVMAPMTALYFLSILFGYIALATLKNKEPIAKQD